MTQPNPSLAPMTPGAAPAKAKMSTGVKLLIGCAILVPTSLCCVGMGSAVAIPAFLRYTRQSKTAEASTLLSELRTSVTARCLAEQPTVSAGPVPVTPSADRQVADFGSDPGFTALQFAPPDPVYFSYSVISVGDGSSRLVAEGDLDADGIRSHFEIPCSAACECGELTIDQELE